MPELKSDSLKEAMAIVSVRYGKKKLPPPKIKGWPAFGALVPLSKVERRQLQSVRDLVRRFVHQPSHVRPLCVAVFGPPGSGKSFAVEQIAAEALGDADASVLPTTINLTQVASPAELSSALATALLGATSDVVPLLFFDEFDTARDGAPYGWLSWFLAPMHDGKFIYDGKIIPVNRAIFVFAGGTAATMEEFSSRHDDPTFRNAKGPDFVSRLRGFLEVAGPNSEPRMLRRALVLRNAIAKRVEQSGLGSLRVDKGLLAAMLQVGRYRHGARSISALVELSEAKSKTIDWSVLPDDHLVAMQIDRGPLDPRAIGGSIALSGFARRDIKQRPSRSITMGWIAVVRALLNEGATLAYAGRWIQAGAELTQFVKDELSMRPAELSANPSIRAAPRPRFRSFVRSFDREKTRQSVGRMISAKEQSRIGIELVVASPLARDERQWGSEDWRARAIERFRRRLAVTECSVARFVIGGEPPDGNERPSGVVEETILSLALSQPVYIAGGFGGAAADLGIVLGLSGLRTGRVPKSLQNHLSSERCLELKGIADRLRPPPFTNLPVLPEEQVEFLRQRAIGGPAWTDNGLALEENRRLFKTRDPDEVARLTLRGLTALCRRHDAWAATRPR